MTYQLKYIFQENLICVILIHFPEGFKKFCSFGFYGTIYSSLKQKCALNSFVIANTVGKKCNLCLLLEVLFFPIFQNQIHIKCLSFSDIYIGVILEIVGPIWTHSSLFLAVKVLCVHLAFSCSFRNS